MSRDDYERVMAFLERTKDADMVTCDVQTKLPLFAHYRRQLKWDGRKWPAEWYEGCTVVWDTEPTPELRAKELSVRSRMIFSEICPNPTPSVEGEA